MTWIGHSPISASDEYAAATKHQQEIKRLLSTLEHQDQIDQTYRSMTRSYWLALVLGHPQAPYGLSKCFNDGLGIAHKKYLANVLFGVAKELGEPQCRLAKGRQLIPASIEPEIEYLAQYLRQGATLNQTLTPELIRHKIHWLDQVPLVGLPQGCPLSRLITGNSEGYQ